MTWAVQRLRLSPTAFHARDLPDPVTRQVWVCEATAPALVLGSTQREDVVDHPACARAGVEVVRRHSGGGAVLVVPGDLLWVDVLVPRRDPLWHDDVATAFHWLGEVWASAVGEHGLVPSVHLGALEAAPWSREVCFAGLGPGEVTVGGAKVVGMAQRRTRSGARFQCAALARWDPGALVGLLRLPADAAAGLAGVAAGLPVAPPVLLESLLRHLP